MAVAAPPPSDRPGTFAALRVREFRLLWIALLVSAVGTWMQIVSLSLLVLRLTNNSAVALGLVSLAQALSFFLFSVPGGAAADRFDRRRLLLVTQTLLALNAAALGVLTVTHLISLPVVLGLAFLSSAVLSFDQPARSALVPTLVPPGLLTNAVALQSVAFSAASAVGPAIAGFLAGVVGPAGNFFLNAASFAGILGVLFVLRPPPQERRASRSLWRNVAEALKAVRGDAALPWLLTGYGALLFFGPSVSLILPLFARTVLHEGEAGLGWLFTAVGAGTITGGLVVASLGNVRRGRLFLGATVAWVAALALLGFARALPLALAALAAYGLALSVAQSGAIALMQSRVAPEMRGRVMGLNTLLMMGVRPLGDFPLGALTGVLGVPGVVWLGAGAVGAFWLLLSTKRGLRDA